MFIFQRIFVIPPIDYVFRRRIEDSLNWGKVGELNEDQYAPKKIVSFSGLEGICEK